MLMLTTPYYLHSAAILQRYMIVTAGNSPSSGGSAVSARCFSDITYFYDLCK